MQVAYSQLQPADPSMVPPVTDGEPLPVNGELPVNAQLPVDGEQLPASDEHLYIATDGEQLPASDEQHLYAQGDDDEEDLESSCGSVDSVASDSSSDSSLISVSSSPLKPIGRLAPGALTGVKRHDDVNRHDGVKPMGRLEQLLHANDEQPLHANDGQLLHANNGQLLHANDGQLLHANNGQLLHAQGEQQLPGGTLDSQGAGMPPPSSQEPAACSLQPPPSSQEPATCSLQPPPSSQDISHVSHQPVSRCIHHLIKLIMRTVEEEVAMFKGKKRVTLTQMAIRTWLHGDADKQASK